MEEKPSRAGAGGAKRRCRYGAECRIKHKCKFLHPPFPTEATNDVTCPVVKRPHSKKDKSKIQCRYGMECRNTKCPFFHHPAAVPVCVSSSASPNRVSSPNGAANILLNGKIPPKSTPNFSDVVRNGQNKPTELPSVTSEQPSPLVHSSIGKTSAATTPPRKATTKKKCRWGAGCRNKKCTFIHPGQQFDREAANTPRPKAAVNPNEGNAPKAETALLNHKTVPSANGVREKPAVKPAVHSILPPSPVTQELPDSFHNTSYPPGLHFPSTDSHISAAFQTQTSEAMSRFNNIFSPVLNTPTTGFLADGSRERTPLYSKTASSFGSTHSLNAGMTDGAFDTHEQFCQPPREVAGENHQVVHPQDQPPDANWLFEVLGLNDIGGNDTVTRQQNEPTVGNVVGDTCTDALCNMGDSTAVSSPKVSRDHSFSDGEIRPKNETETSHTVANSPKIEFNERPSKKLVPEDEIVQSRRAALELRFESHQNANNPELLFALLQTCRSKQEMIRIALESSMEGAAETELDETNVVALLELNELLVGAIDAAESSLKIAQRNGQTGEGESMKKVAAAKSSSGKSAVVPKKKEDSSWKPVDRKAALPAKKTATKKTKPNENPGKVKKSLKKATPQSKPAAKTPNADHQKQDDKPTIAPPQSKQPADDSLPSPEHNSDDAAQQEKEKMARMLEEARKQAAAAREKKKSKKNKKFDRWLKQNEEARENRARSWGERIAKENDYIDLIQKLLGAEFLRQSKNKAMGLTADRLLSDTDASEIIVNECREAYHIIFGGFKCRIVVAGSENKDMNGRQGTVRYWDREREKFCVGLDTKKSPDSDVQFLVSEILDLLTSSRPPKGDKKSSATSYDVDVPHLMSYGGVSLGISFTLQKSHVVALGSAESTKIGLEAFRKSRDNEERRQKIEEEAEKKREEEDRKRRAARRATENSEWERRKDQMRKDKEEYEEMRREWAREKRDGGSMFDYDDDDEEDEEECPCPRCRMKKKFTSSGGAFFFNIGGIPFRVRFDSYDSDEESFFDEFDDERWEEKLAEEKEEENSKHAAILGVDPEDDSRTIKLAYRKMALQYHPDKWKSNSDHGMSRKEAENRFKSIQNAYDHLMSNFDD